MTKERYKVEYGGVTYEQGKLNFEDTIRFGTTIQPKIAGLASTIGAIVSDKAVVNSEVLSFYQTIERIFSPDEWMYLMKLFLVNEKNLLIVDGQALTTEEIEDHFAGDFLRMYMVACQLARKNLGESSPFMESLSGCTKSIADFLSNLLKEKLETVENGLKKAVNAKPKK